MIMIKKSKSKSAYLWSGTEVVLRQGMQFFVTIALTRMLVPEDFGLIAMLYVLISLASIFIEAGLSSALIQRKDPKPEDESTVFLFNITMGALLAISLCFAGPYLAEYSGKPMLKDLIYWLSLNLFITSLGSIHNILLTKELKFKILMKIGVISSFISGGLAMLLAWLGYGVWSLVLQTLSSSIVTTGLLWKWHAWPFRLVFSFSALRSLFKFGGYMLFSSILNTLYLQASVTLIWKLSSMNELGLYNRAESLQRQPVNILGNILNRVAFPVFSSTVHNTAELVGGMRRVLKIMMIINIPAMLGMMVLAKPIVLILFGEAWLHAVIYLQILCLAGIFWPAHLVNLSALQALGRSDLFFKIEIFKKITGIAVIIIFSAYGVMGIAWSQVALSAISFYANAYHNGRLNGYGFILQIYDLMFVFISGINMVFFVYIASQLVRWNPLLWSPIWEITFLAGIGGCAYILVCQLTGVINKDTLLYLIKA